MVTGAYGFTGRYITRLLLEKGYEVKTLTGHPDRPDPFNGRVKAAPFNFENTALLVKELEGADVVFNTYWVRFNYGDVTYGRAVANVQNLMCASVEARIPRFVHISITNPSEESSSSYFRGKALMEKTLVKSGLSYAIVRPTVLFGLEDVLINNIAWLLRRFPIFAIPGTGEYRLQPVHVADVALLAVQASEDKNNLTIDAVGPETYSFEALVKAVKKAIGSRTRLIRLAPSLCYAFTAAIDPFVRDIIVTRDEIKKLMLDNLVSYEPPMGKTRFSSWLMENADRIGRDYASELKRHFH